MFDLMERRGYAMMTRTAWLGAERQRSENSVREVTRVKTDLTSSLTCLNTEEADDRQYSRLGEAAYLWIHTRAYTARVL